MTRRRKIAPARLSSKRLAQAFVIVALPLTSVFIWHRFADEPTQGRIEIGTLAVVDLVRENRRTPHEIVFWLDLVADAMPVVRGRAVAVDRAVAGNDFSECGAPVANRPLTTLHNLGYDVGYDETLRNPVWVSYKVFAPRFPDHARPRDFETDRRTLARVESRDYAHSGYDRGHMAPNNAICLDYGTSAQRETFLMSNIAPQRHALNAGLWKTMEQRILRRYPARFTEVRVTCGPVFDGTPRYIGGRVRVPDAFYLIVSDRDDTTGELRAQAYLVPAGQEAAEADPSDYLTEIRSIERRTGLNFFPRLPAASQDRLETAKAIKAW